MELLKSQTKQWNIIAAWADAVTICHDHHSRKIFTQKGPVGVQHWKRQEGKREKGMIWMYIHRFLCCTITLWCSIVIAILQRGGLADGWGWYFCAYHHRKSHISTSTSIHRHWWTSIKREFDALSNSLYISILQQKN